jgi:hypothetical protein
VGVVFVVKALNYDIDTPPMKKIGIINIHDKPVRMARRTNGVRVSPKRLFMKEQL